MGKATPWAPGPPCASGHALALLWAPSGLVNHFQEFFQLRWPAVQVLVPAGSKPGRCSQEGPSGSPCPSAHPAGTGASQRPRALSRHSPCRQVPNTVLICMVILLNIGLAILFVHLLT